jgi:hypothetical protein
MRDVMLPTMSVVPHGYCSLSLDALRNVAKHDRRVAAGDWLAGLSATDVRIGMSVSCNVIDVVIVLLRSGGLMNSGKSTLVQVACVCVLVSL